MFLLNKISKKFVVILLSIFILVLIILGTFAYRFINNMRNILSEKAASEIMLAVESDINGKLRTFAAISMTLSQYPDIKKSILNEDHEKAKQILKKLEEEYKNVDFKGLSFHLIRSNLTTFLRSSSDLRNDDVSFRASLREVISNKKVLSIIESGKRGVLLRGISPIFGENGEIIGILDISGGVGSIHREQKNLHNNYYILLVNKKSVDEKNFREKVSDQEIGGDYFTANKKWFEEDVVSWAKSAPWDKLKERNIVVDKTGVYAIYPAKDFTGKEIGKHMVGLSAEEMLKRNEPIRKAVFSMLGIFILTIILIMVVIYLGIKIEIVNPITKLGIFFGKLDTDLTLRCNINKNDEIGEISKKINQFLDRFSNSLILMRDASSAIEVNKREIVDMVEYLVSSLSEIVNQTNSVASAAEELNATAANISDNTQIAARDASDVENAAKKGGEVVLKTSDNMKHIVDKVEDTSKLIAELGSKSDQIGTIVQTIEDIADQTNLLALNAAIEAARAGEAGRGFAVVADEVRKLAERTGKATKEISEMIGQIRDEISLAVKEMQNTADLVNSGKFDAERSGEALKDIIKSINNLVNQVNGIATAAGQQKSAIYDITSSVNTVSRSAEESAEKSKELLILSERLQELSGELEKVVNKFKV